MRQVMLTTVDNPFDPFTEYDSWDLWDRTRGYCSAAYLARVVKFSDELSEADQMLIIEQGIDEIIRYDVLDVYIKVVKDVEIDNRPSALLSDSSNT